MKTRCLSLLLWSLAWCPLWVTGTHQVLNSPRFEPWMHAFITPTQLKQAIQDEGSLWGLTSVGGALKGTLSAGIADRVNHHLNRFIKEVLVHQKLWPANSTPEQDKALYQHWASWFHAAGGTSTGALQTTSWTVVNKSKPVLAPQTTQTVLDFYLKEADENNPRPIFDLNRSWFWSWLQTKYNPQNLEQLLQEYFGDSTHADTLFEIPLFTVAYNLTTSELVVFGDGYKPDVLVRDSARASSAVPVLFPGKEIDGEMYGDGAFGMNDPTLKLLGFFMKTKTKNQKCILVTLGTGDNRKDLSFLGELNYVSSLYNIRSLLMSLAYGITDGPQDATKVILKDITQHPEWEAIPIHPNLPRMITPDDPLQIGYMETLLKTTFVGPEAYKADADALPASKMIFLHPEIQKLYDRLKGRCFVRLQRLISFFESSTPYCNLSQEALEEGGEGARRFASLYFSVLEHKLKQKASIPLALDSNVLILNNLSLEGSLHPKQHLNNHRFERLLAALKGSPSMQSLRYLNLGKNSLGTRPANPKNALQALRDLLKEGNQLTWIHLNSNDFDEKTPGGLDALIEVLDNLPCIRFFDLSHNAWEARTLRALREHPQYDHVHLKGKMPIVSF